MSDFKIVNKSPEPVEMLLDVLTFGMKSTVENALGLDSTKVYTVEDSSGNRRQVSACNSEELGAKIARGEFRD